MNDLVALARLIQALDQWRNQLVFIGGWAHRLHRLDPRANLPNYQPLITRDTDLAFANQTLIEGNIKTALIENGFKEDLNGENKPPVTHYTLGEENEGFYAEFLTPLIGSGIKRGGAPDATLKKAGISAQKIRHLDILLVHPWTIKLTPESGIPLPSAMDIQVANPLCFMVQKFLIQKDRQPDKQAKDILYIYDTIELFGTLFEEFNESWNAVIKPELGEKLSGRVMELSKSSFASVNDMTRTAARIPKDRELSPKQIQQTCEYAFEQILGA